MYAARLWSVRHARGLRRVYETFAQLAPLLRALGPARAERLLRPVEKGAKQLMFDCRMCGQCVLSATGMACPMNCAKEMRNGACGGVRADGHCEVKPVWVEATAGTKRIAPDHLAHPTPLLPAIRAIGPSRGPAATATASPSRAPSPSVPGGIGPMTITMLLASTIEAVERSAAFHAAP